MPIPVRPDSEGPPASGWLNAFDARWPGVRRRLGSLGLAIALEVGLLLFLLTLGQGITGSRQVAETLTSISFAPEAEPEDVPEEPQKTARKSPLVPAAKPVVTPVERPAPIVPVPIPSPAAVLPVAKSTQAPPPAAVPGKIAVRMRDDTSGPAGAAGAAGASMSGDSQVVGSGPNGEPVYGARWYREPTNAELRGYLSTVGEPGWATINCKTAPGWRVEDCYLLDQYPDPSNMGRAVLAAAWQFQVRPPVRGGKSLVGEWVRIRISYELRKSKAPG